MAFTSSSPGAGDGTLTLTLIPGLPDDIAALILASLPYSHRSRIRPTARAWHAFLSSASVAPLRRRLRLPPSHILCLFPSDPALVRPLLFDPAAAAWAPLPPLPCSPYLYGLSNFATIALGPHLYVLGGSHFDARSYPLGLPSPSAAVHRIDLSAAPAPHLLSWTRMPDMLSPRGSFACAPIAGANAIIVAGGGSRHAVFPSGGTRMSSVETFDVLSGKWAPAMGLPRYRAGCVGFFLRRGIRKLKDEEELDYDEEEEFWVMGGYGDYRPVAGVVPANVYYRDVLVLGLRSGNWREIGDMWNSRERHKLGQVVVMDGEDGDVKGVFMLDRNVIFRHDKFQRGASISFNNVIITTGGARSLYNFASNRWLKESSLRRAVPLEDSRGFVAMNGELCVLTSMPFVEPLEPGRSSRSRMTLEIQAYDPKRKKWSSSRAKTFAELPHSISTVAALLLSSNQR
ncbi:F-box/kelch-repeat protein OR23 [Apostasia shenzhenica]|uniref:F-box/kelch-repeat protein OR23 n=1 Tax=Apostasia shenzhenica TaxID=1088818 RepID=A0A2I0A9Q6_9ASPA|nr:F-box/kelch-repeat protein OR23 [Apostasia shenzhenica]